MTICAACGESYPAESSPSETPWTCLACRLRAPSIDPRELAKTLVSEVAAEVYRRPVGRMGAALFLAHRTRGTGDDLATTIERAAQILAAGKRPR